MTESTKPPRGARVIRLRYPGRCALCDVVLTVNSEAWHDPSARKAHCLRCGNGVLGLDEQSILEPLPAPAAVDGAPGASAQREADRKSDARVQRVRTAHPRIGGMLLALSDDPQSTRAWRTGASGERAVGRRLNEWATSGGGAVLHDRRIPGTRANIDHIAVAPGGVWVIDAKQYTGRVEEVNVGGLLRRDMRLRVGGRDRSKLAAAVLGQMETVAAALDRSRGEEAPPQVFGMLCFVGADWKLFAKPFIHAGVHVTWPVAAVKLLTAETTVFDRPQLLATAAMLQRAFPSA